MKLTADENCVLVSLVKQNQKLCESLMKNQNVQSNKLPQNVQSIILTNLMVIHWVDYDNSYDRK